MRYYVLTIFVIITLFIGGQANAISVGIGHGGIQFDFGNQHSYPTYRHNVPIQECFYNNWGQLICNQYSIPQQQIYVVPKKHLKKHWKGQNKKGKVIIYKKGW